MTTAHEPSRPGWTCVPCRQPWPCLAARQRLRKQFGRDRVGLSIEMNALLYVAATDLYIRANETGVDPTELHDRFVAWTR